jgi:beta-glucosidase
MIVPLLFPFTHKATLRSLILLFLLVSRISSAPATRASDALGKMEDQTIDQKVEKTLSRMSLADKLAELQGIRPNELMVDGKLSLEECRKKIPNGIGQLCQFSTSLSLRPEELRDLVRGIQHYLMTETPAHIPAIFHEEMITGFPTVGSTTYPQHLGIGCTWNPDLVQKSAEFTADSARKVGSTLALSPMLDVTKTPYWERMEEGFGEDCLLTARLGLAFVQGLQGADLKTGVAATGKHFAAYGGSYKTDAEFHDEYLMPHEVAVSMGGVPSIMANYAQYKGIPSVASKELLTDILRKQLGFKGVVVSDYGAVDKQVSSGAVKSLLDAGVNSLNAGNDVELAKGVCFPLLPEALKQRRVSQERIDEAVRHSLTLKARLGLLDENPRIGEDGALDLDPPAHRQTAYEAACQSVVLLKNDGVLPLGKKVRKIALVGPNSDSMFSLVGDYTYQALSTFWWNIQPDASHPKFVTLLDGLKARTGDKITLKHERGCDWSRSMDGTIDVEFGDSRLKEVSKRMRRVIELVHSGLAEPNAEQALKIAASSDVIVAAMGGNIYLCGEGRKTSNIRLPGDQEAFVRKLIATGKPVILVLFGGRPVVLNGLERECAAVLNAWYPGEEGGKALADILFGDVNPSGKLCISYPAADSREPLYYNEGYSAGEKPLYPFGYGLSYTTYAYSDLKVPDSAPITAESIPVTLKVKNTGARAGTEVVQLYVSPMDPNSSLKPIRLQGFRRFELAPGEEKSITFNLSPEQLCSWKDDSWGIEPGTYRIRVGSSSADLPLEAKVTLKGEKKVFKKRTHFWCS